MSGIIGVMPLFDEEKDSIWMLPGYLEGIQMAGGVPIILPLTAAEEQVEQLYHICDGFLFTGGHDVNPDMYKESKSELCGKLNKDRDNLETRIFQMAYRDNKPILGICRGIQIINVLLGGSLYQDIEARLSKQVSHVMKPPYDRSVHNVRIYKESPLYQTIGMEIIGVNSYHHQGIKKIAPDLQEMAVAPDGLVEAVCSRSRDFVWGVQWHPEFSYKNDVNSRKIFEAFVRACGRE